MRPMSTNPATIAGQPSAPERQQKHPPARDRADAAVAELLQSHAQVAAAMAGQRQVWDALIEHAVSQPDPAPDWVTQISRARALERSDRKAMAEALLALVPNAGWLMAKARAALKTHPTQALKAAYARYRRAQEKLIVAYNPLLTGLLGSIGITMANEWFDDRLQLARMTMLSALDQYDPQRLGSPATFVHSRVTFALASQWSRTPESSIGVKGAPAEFRCVGTVDDNLPISESTSSLDDAESLQHLSDRCQELTRLRAAIAQLEPRTRFVITLAVGLDGHAEHRPHELARRLGLPVSEVGALYRDGLRALRKAVTYP